MASLALIAISALHGPFRKVRVEEIAALSVLPGEKESPEVFSTRRIEVAGVSYLVPGFCTYGKLTLEREKSSVLVSSQQSKPSHLLIWL